METGTYNIHIYSESNGQLNFVSATKFDVNEYYGGQLSIENQDDHRGTAKVVLSGVSSTFGIRSIWLPVWGEENGQNDIVWYSPEKAGESWYININYLKHAGERGSYNVHAYVEDELGNMHFLSHLKLNIDADTTVSLSTELNSDQSKFSVYLLNYVGSSKSDIKFAVWGEENGQNDIVWYDARKTDGLYYSAEIDVAGRHREAGTYNIHVYEFGSGQPQFIAHGKQYIDKISVKEDVIIENKDENSGKFHIHIPSVVGPAQITSVLAAVWSQNNDQDDIIWYPAQQSTDGSWHVDVDLIKHHLDLGTYHIHVYASDERGMLTFIGATQTSFIQVIERTDLAGATDIPVQAGNGIETFNYSRALSQGTLSQLQSAVANFTNAGKQVGFVIMDMNTGAGIYYNSNQKFHGASCAKAMYVACLCEKVPNSVSVHSHLMANTIKISSNQSYETLRYAYGNQVYAEWLAEAGVSFLPQAFYPTLSTQQLAQSWTKIYGYFNSDKTNAAYCKSLYTHTANSPISSVLGAQYTVYSKSGWNNSDNLIAQNDAGIVMRDGHPYVIAILSNAYGRYDLLNHLTAVLNMAHEEMIR